MSCLYLLALSAQCICRVYENSTSLQASVQSMKIEKFLEILMVERQNPLSETCTGIE